MFECPEQRVLKPRRSGLLWRGVIGIVLAAASMAALINCQQPNGMQKAPGIPPEASSTAAAAPLAPGIQVPPPAPEQPAAVPIHPAPAAGEAGAQAAVPAGTAPAGTSPVGAVQAGTAPAAQAPGAAPGPASADCAEQLKSSRELFKSIPLDFRELKEPLDAVVDRVERCRALLEKFLSSCSPVEGSQDAGFMLARLLMSLSRRQQMDWFQKHQGEPEKVQTLMKGYYNRIIQLARDSLARCGEKDPIRPACHDLIGDASFQNRDHEEALKNYQIIISRHPDFAEISNTLMAAGQAYLELKRFKDGIAFITKAIQDRQKDPNLPNFYEVHWKLLEASGDLDGMEKHCREIQKIFPVRLLKSGASRSETDDYFRYLGYSGFRLGYTLFARGDLGGAHEAFSRHVEDMARREEELKQAGRNLPQELQIFRNRSSDIARIIDEQVGKPPENDLGDVIWATPGSVRIQPGSGKAVALVFRSVGDTRSAGFLKALDKHIGANSKNKQFAVISFLKDANDPQAHLAEMQTDLVEMGLENTAGGLDPDQKQKPVFRAFKVMVGSATFIIFDRQGNLAWYQQDPREVDSNLGIRILDRIAGE